MAIYIEYVLVDNIVMNYIIINLIEITVGRRLCKWNKIVVCVLGGVLALILPTVMHLDLFAFIYKITTSIVLVCCLQKYKNIKIFFVYYLMFFAYTFFVGGVCIGLIQLLGIECTMSSVVMYQFEFPVGLFGGVLLCVIKIMNKVVRTIKCKATMSNYIHKIKLLDCGNVISGYGLLDSGNNVKCDGMGVSVISMDIFLKMYRNINIQDLILDRLDKSSLRDCKYISIAGIGGEQKCLSFLIDCIEIDNCKYESQRVAVVYKNFGEYDVVLSNQFIGGRVCTN